MKIVYIGTSDALAESLITRLGQEGNDVYLVSDKKLPSNEAGAIKHRHFPNPRKGESFQDLITSIAPECIIFAGNQYMAVDAERASEDDINLLSRALQAAAKLPDVKFVLLSSTDVYGNATNANERTERNAAAESAIRFLREEQLVEIYEKQHKLNCTIVRIAQLYSQTPQAGKKDFLSAAYTHALKDEQRNNLDNTLRQPLHLGDLAEAIKRIIENGNSFAYNVAGDEELSARELYSAIMQSLDRPEHAIIWQEPEVTTTVDTGLLKRELDWRNFHTLQDEISQGKISYKESKDKVKKEKKTIITKGFRQILEILALFVLFCGLSVASVGHPLFSQFDWLLIYIVLIAITYSPFQSILATILSTIALLVEKNPTAFITGAFSDYAGNFLTIAEYVFIGLIVSYTVSTLRETTRTAREDLLLTQAEYEDLRVINDENVLIKNEYEDRLLASKNGLPHLYSLINRLMLQEPNRIMLEMVNVVSDLANTDTVAVYRGKPGSAYLRLIHALNDKSIVGVGKTWDISDYPNIAEAIAKGELYQGELGSDEPAIVLPILYEGSPEAVVVLQELPFESESLYHINLLKTLSLLLSDSLHRAFEYEAMLRAERFVENTHVLKPEFFEQQVVLAQEKTDKNLAEYCIVELAFEGDFETAANEAVDIVRDTDSLGTDDKGALFALLNNMSIADLKYLDKRLADKPIAIKRVLNEDASSQNLSEAN